MLDQQLLPRSASRGAVWLRAALLILAGTVLMTLCAQVSFPLPFTPVPLSLQTLGVLLIGALYGPRLGFLTLLAYLLEGLAGLPVFALGHSAWSASTASLPVILGPTAGYLLACPFAAALVGALMLRGWGQQVRSALLALLLGDL